MLKCPAYLQETVDAEPTWGKLPLFLPLSKGLLMALVSAEILCQTHPMKGISHYQVSKRNEKPTEHMMPVDLLRALKYRSEVPKDGRSHTKY